jgi:hypothetical protein
VERSTHSLSYCTIRELVWKHSKKPMRGLNQYKFFPAWESKRATTEYEPAARAEQIPRENVVVQWVLHLIRNLEAPGSDLRS